MPKKKDENDNLFCSFCGKNQSEVRKLIAGPAVYICDECIQLCSEIIEEESEKDADALENLLAQGAVALALMLFSLNFLGDGLRDAFDPKMRGRS